MSDLAKVIREVILTGDTNVVEIADALGAQGLDVIMAVNEREGYDPQLQRRIAEHLGVNLDDDEPQPPSAPPAEPAPRGKGGQTRLTEGGRQRKREYARAWYHKNKAKKAKEGKREAKRLHRDGMPAPAAPAEAPVREGAAPPLPADGLRDKADGGHTRPAGSVPQAEESVNLELIRAAGLIADSMRRHDKPVVTIEITRGDTTTVIRVPMEG